jgi:hypothetical protein
MTTKMTTITTQDLDPELGLLGVVGHFSTSGNLFTPPTHLSPGTKRKLNRVITIFLLSFRFCIPLRFLVCSSAVGRRGWRQSACDNACARGSWCKPEVAIKFLVRCAPSLHALAIPLIVLHSTRARHRIRIQCVTVSVVTHRSTSASSVREHLTHPTSDGCAVTWRPGLIVRSYT